MFILSAPSIHSPTFPLQLAHCHRSPAPTRRMTRCKLLSRPRWQQGIATGFLSTVAVSGTMATRPSILWDAPPPVPSQCSQNIRCYRTEQRSTWSLAGSPLITRWIWFVDILGVVSNWHDPLLPSREHTNTSIVIDRSKRDVSRNWVKDHNNKLLADDKGHLEEENIELQ